MACGLAAAGFLGLSAITSAQAAPVTAFDNFPDIVPTQNRPIGSVYTWGNIFTAQASGTVSLVEAYMYSFGEEPAVKMTLYEWTGASTMNPFGAELGSSEINPAAGLSLRSFTGWGSAAVLTEGATYALIARTETPASFGPGWSIFGAFGDPTPLAPGDGGELGQGFPDWIWTAEPTENTARLAVRVTVDSGDISPPAPIPLPASLPLLAGGAALLASLGRRRRPE